MKRKAKNVHSYRCIFESSLDRCNSFYAKAGSRNVQHALELVGLNPSQEAKSRWMIYGLLMIGDDATFAEHALKSPI